MSELLPPIGDAYSETHEPIPDEPLSAYEKIFVEASYADVRMAHLPDEALLLETLPDDVLTAQPEAGQSNQS
jgi:hypothetical protein